MTNISDWSTYSRDMLTELWDRFANFVPNLVGGLLIILFGVVIAYVVAYLVTLVLRLAKAQTLSDQLGVTDVLKKAKVSTDIAKVAGNLFRWVIVFAFMIPVAQVLKVVGVKDFFESILTYVPVVIGVLILIALGLKFADFIGGLVKAATEGLGLTCSNLLKLVAQTAIITSVGILAMFSLGVPREFTVIMFIGITSALALGIGLSLGLGAKDHMNELVKAVRDEISKKK